MVASRCWMLDTRYRKTFQARFMFCAVLVFRFVFQKCNTEADELELLSGCGKLMHDGPCHEDFHQPFQVVQRVAFPNQITVREVPFHL